MARRFKGVRAAEADRKHSEGVEMSEASLEASSVDTSRARYTTVAIVLHWAIAAAIAFQMWSGMTAEGSSAYAQIQLHKAVGVTILLLTVIRLAWRLAHPAPTLPSEMPGWQKLASHASHWLFYAALIAIPVSGWVMVSANPDFSMIPTMWFKLFTIPHLPFFDAMDVASRKNVTGLAHEAHELMSNGMLALLALHVGAALKHHFVDRDATLARMTPGVKPRMGALGLPIRRVISIGRRIASLGLWLIAVIAIVAAGYAIYRAKAIRGDKGVTEATVGLIAPTSSEPAAPAAPAEAEKPATRELPDASDAAKAGAPIWTPLYDQSAVVVKTSVSGAPVEITLSWKATIAFDPDNLAISKVDVIFDMAKAKVSDPQLQSGMSDTQWLDVASHPTATFHGRSFEKLADGSYSVYGGLTLKGEEKPFGFSFRLKIDGDRAEMVGEATVMRIDFGVGEGQTSAMHPPLEAKVDIKLVAERKK
ncbi:MAG: cytochrome b/b6 domain-containing protein [Neomegalonema sp.]|nr:cytochrome b/b6 domain-containing protein [Neomegalonema sp.]